jgi:tetratricopeptide (TPR) repeat protein
MGAQQYFTNGQAFFDDPFFKQDPIGAAVSAYAYGTLTAWMLGYADAARTLLTRLEAATDNSNPYIVILARIHEFTFWALMREYSRAEILAMQAVELADKHEFPEAAARSRCMLGEARAQLGDAPNGIALIRENLPRLLTTGRATISKYAIALAWAQARTGAFADAFEIIDQMLTMSPDEPAYRPEALRIHGLVRLKLGQNKLAEASFRDAIAFAQRISAKAWELRSNMSLARLLASEGRRDEARTILAEIYGWFTEGFDTADLKDAKALLDEVAT